MKTQSKIKVHVRMFDGTTFWAYVFCEEGVRVQDLLNDDRKFIPMEKLQDKRGVKSEDVTTIVCVHKDGLYVVEER